MRRITYDLDLETAQRIVERIDLALEVVGVGRLDGGSTEVYHLDLAGRDEPLVLKIYMDDDRQWMAAKEARIARLYNGALDLPTPRWLTLDESRTLMPLRYAVITWLPGQTLRHWIGQPVMEDVYRQMGALIRRTHVVPMEAYGYLVAEGFSTASPTNTAFMARNFERVTAEFRERGGDPGLTRRLETLIEENRHLAARSAGPVLCHDDFHQGNVLAVQDPDGALRLSGLIDFGNARAADPLFDLAKALFCCRHEDPASTEPLLAGYGPIDHPEPEGALALYTLHHRMSMWCFLTKIGKTQDTAALIADLEAMVA